MAKASKIFNYIPKPDGGVRILLYGDVGHYADIDSRLVVAELLSLEGQYSSIDIHINSNGGDVFSGIAIYNALRQSRANITIYIDGLAASIAGIIALCGKPLYMSQYARLMLHKVSGGAYGSAKDLREMADLIDSLEKSLADMIANRISLTPDEVYNRYFADGSDHWLTAQEALELGVIDGIYDLPEESSLSDASSTEEIYAVFTNRLQQTNYKNNDMALLEEIKKIPSFENVATEAEVITRLKEQETKLDVQGQALNDMKAKLEAMDKEKLEALLNTAIADGRITEEQKPTYMNLLKSDRSNTEALLKSLPKGKPSNQPYNYARQFVHPQDSSNSNEFYGKTWDELDKAGLLAKFKEQDPTGFANAYKAEFGAEYKF